MNMERDQRYDPQDLEQLLEEKTFEELLDDERAFVLKHVADRNEYQRIRQTMFAVRSEIAQEEPPLPRPELRRELIAAFKEEKKKGYRYWLNSVFAWFIPQEGKAAWAPLARLASLALVVGMAWFGLNKISLEDRVAELPVKTEDQLEKQFKTESIEQPLANSSDNEDVEGLAENSYEPVLDELQELEAPAEEEMTVFVADEVALDDESPIAHNEPERELFDADMLEMEEEVIVESDAVPEYAELATSAAPNTAEDAVIVTEMRQLNNAPASVTATKARRVLRDEVVKESVAFKSNSRSLAADAQLISILVQAY